jgi:hypothetical protein
MSRGLTVPWDQGDQNSTVLDLLSQHKGEWFLFCSVHSHWVCQEAMESQKGRGETPWLLRSTYQKEGGDRGCLSLESERWSSPRAERKRQLNKEAPRTPQWLPHAWFLGAFLAPELLVWCPRPLVPHQTHQSCGLNLESIVKTKRERKGLGVAQMIEDLPSKFKILSSNPSPATKGQKNSTQVLLMQFT